MNNITPDYIFESSWEVCNMMGGIYTVLSTRAATLQKQHGDKLIFIGPDVWFNNKSPYFVEDENLYPEFKAHTLSQFQLQIRIGRWDIPGNPVAVLVDFRHLMGSKNEIYARVWNKYGVNSLASYGDYDDSSMFGFASGMVIDSFCKVYKLDSNPNIVAHFNEWQTTFGIFYLQEYRPQIATIFTTHATSIGRSIAGNNKPLYDYLSEYNGDQMAYELNMVSKHSAEKAAAHCVDCFTTVSEITAIECEQLLEIKPHIVTPNGFENDFVAKGSAFNTKRKQARLKLRHVAETLLGYDLEEDVLFMGTAGRYEFKNKGIDTFIESLKYLQNHNKTNRQIVAFIMVPAWIKGLRADLQYSLKNPQSKLYSYNRTSTHELQNYYNDQVMSTLHWFHFFNTQKERIKIIFVPSYLNGADGIFDMTYYDLLIGLDLTVFPSYYEPWGYTPLESIAFSVPTITTNLSGFGRWSIPFSQDISQGVGIISRSDYNAYEVARDIAAMMSRYLNFDSETEKNARNNAKTLAQKALWKHFIVHYHQAYQIAIDRKNKRLSHLKNQ